MASTPHQYIPLIPLPIQGRSVSAAAPLSSRIPSSDSLASSSSTHARSISTASGTSSQSLARSVLTHELLAESGRQTPASVSSMRVETGSSHLDVDSLMDSQGPATPISERDAGMKTPVVELDQRAAFEQLTTESTVMGGHREESIAGATQASDEQMQEQTDMLLAVYGP